MNRDETAPRKHPRCSPLLICALVRFASVRGPRVLRIASRERLTH
jgi:hypothetical protein